MEEVHWTKVVLVVLILSLGISIVATAVSNLVHGRTTGNSWERSALVSQRIDY